MRLNNKGFAITTVLYGLLILFVILVSSYLLVLSARKNRIDKIIENAETEYNEKNATDNNSITVDDGEMDDIIIPPEGDATE